MQFRTSTAMSRVLVRLRSALLITCIAFPARAACHSAPPEELPLVRVSTNSGSYVGELQNEDEKAVQLFDLESNRSVSISKTSVNGIENPISLDDAAGYVGLPAVMGRKISLLSQRPVRTGKIARIGIQIVYLTLGESSGVTVGQKVSVFRGEEDILDPDTGKVLASERAKIAELVISEINQNVSKARLIGDLEVKLEVGDQVEPQGARLIVAVCPLSNDDGSANPTGNSLAEELVSALVQRKISVVERSVLAMVLSELAAQNTILFDPKSAQRLGKLTGASMVLAGKVIQEKTTAKAHLRLIDVQTGEILLAVSAPVKLTPPVSAATASTGTRPGTPGSSSRGDVPQPNGELEQLGKSRSLPKYLTTASPLQRTSEGGVRFTGQKKHEEYESGIILTRERNFLERNFIFEVLVTFGPDDGIAHIGIGTGRKDGSANRRAESLFLSFGSPQHGEGQIKVKGWQAADVQVGKVIQQGVHLVRMTKRGNSLTFEVDPENDGPSDGDMESVIPDLRERAPYLNSKNCNLFLSGTATFVATRLEILDGDSETEQPEGREMHTVNLDQAHSFGGTLSESGNAIAVDAAGNVYTTGYFNATADFDPGDGAFKLTSVGDSDVFVLKLDNAGNLVWAKRMGGAGSDNGIAIAVDPSGDVCLMGYFNGTADFDPGDGAFRLTSAGAADIFVSKLDSEGNFAWAIRLGGARDDYGIAMAVDAAGNVHTTGHFFETADFDPGKELFGLTSAGESDIFVSKLDSAGNFVWTKRMGGATGEDGLAIAVDTEGSVYSTGYFVGVADFDPGAGESNFTSAGSADIFVSKLNRDGDFVWAKHVGGSGNDMAYAIAVDLEGNIYTAGSFYRIMDFDSGAGVFNLASTGDYDIFVSKLDSAGDFAWARRMGNTNGEDVQALAIDLAGNIYATGNFHETIDFDPGTGKCNLTSAGEYDSFVLALDNAGNFSWAKRMGGPSGEDVNAIAVDPAGDIYTTGHFNGVADFDPEIGVFNLTSAGISDAFVLKLSPKVPLQ